MSALRLFRQDDFTGGLNLRADQFQLGPSESPRLLNVDIDPRGGVTSRGAMRRTNASAITATNWNPKRIKPFYGSTHYVMVTTGDLSGTNGAVFASANGGSTYTSLGISVTDNDGADFAGWGTLLYMTVGRQAQSRKWDGTTVTTLNASGPTWQDSYTTGLTGTYFPSARHCIVHAGKMFVANTRENGTNYPNRIRWSHPNSPENWASTDFIDINDGSSGITALAVFAGHLLVFKHNAVYAVFGYDSDSFQVVEVSRTVGSANHHSICTTERAVYFYSPAQGLMMYTGQGIIDLFQPIRPAIEDGRIANSLQSQIFVNYVNRKIWVSVPYSESGSVTYPSTSFIYNPDIGQNGAWTMYSTADGRGAAGGCTFVAEDGTQNNLILHPSTACSLAVDVRNNINDNISGSDVPFVSRYRTRWIDNGSYSQKKMYRRPDLVTKQSPLDGIITIKVYGNYEEAEGTEIKTYTVTSAAASSGMLWDGTIPPALPDPSRRWGTGIWGATNSGSQIVSGRGIGLKKSVQLEFVGPTNTPWGLNSYTLKFNPRKVTS